MINHTCKCLMSNIEDALRLSRGKLYVIFIDYAKTFDSVSREILISKLEALIGKDHCLSRMASFLLSRRYVYIDYQLTRSGPIEQKVGVLQGTPSARCYSTLPPWM